MAETIKEVLFLKKAWCFMMQGVGPPCVPVFEGNEGAVQLSQNPATNSNSKHVDIRHHFLREQGATGAISVTHVRSELQHADFLTKPLCAEIFQFCCNIVKNMGWY